MIPAAIVRSAKIVECPECAARITIGDVLQGEILSCTDCGSDLEVRAVTPQLIVVLAPAVEEDWGE